MREVDGLAMSSRNARLSPAQRQQATALTRSIEAAQRAAEKGEQRSAVLIAAALSQLASRPLVQEEYVEVVDPVSLVPVDTVQDSARILVAAQLGDVRLIDNGPIFVS